MTERPYQPIDPMKRIGGILVTHRCKKCGVAVVQSTTGAILDSRYQRADQWGNVTAELHECEARQRKAKRSDLWD